MVLNWTSQEYTVTDGNTQSILIPAGITITKIVGKFKGISTTTQQATAKTVGASGGSSCTIPIGAGEWMISGTATCWMSDPDPPGGTWYWNSAPQGTIYPGQTISRSYSMGTNPTAGNYMGCSVPVYYGISASATVGYYATVELKTNDPWFYIDNQEEYSWYDGIINDGSLQDGGDYNGSMTDLIPGEYNTIHFEIDGSGTCKFQLYLEYEFSRPTQLKTMKVQQGSTIIVLPLVSPTDPALEYDCLRAQLGSTVYCVDVVDTTDSEASPGRFMKGTTIYAVRKVV